jgi:anaerobic dimethyl sulfoxide reductase subunit C
MSVGSFLVLSVVHFYTGRKSGEKQADQLTDRALIAIGPVLMLGMAASLLHLGNPINAYKAVTNLGSSWLSREILLGVLFAASGAVFALMQWRKISTPSIRQIVGLVVALIGVALAFSMSQIYLIPTRPSWDLITTPLSFLTTTLLLGVLAIGAAFVANYWYMQRQEPGCADEQCVILRDTLRSLAISSIVLLGLQFVLLPVSLALMTSAGAADSVALMAGPFGIVFALRLILVFLGAGVFGVFVYREAQRVGQERMLSLFMYTAFVLVLVGEILGRFMFYATAIKFGLQ